MSLRRPVPFIPGAVEVAVTTDTRADARALLTASMSEDDLLKSILELATALGWMSHHQRAGRTAGGSWSRTTEGHAGFPDLVLAHRQFGVVFVECKSATGRLRPAQKAWAGVLDGANEYRWYCWRPADWVSGTIEAVLRGGA